MSVIGPTRSCSTCRTASPRRSTGTSRPPDMKDRYSIPTARHLTELKGHFGSYPTLAPNILLQRKRHHALHMRFIVFAFVDGNRTLYILERGLDIEDPKSGRARNQSYILEFPDVPDDLAPLLGLS
jgi:hypothetical protein